METAVVYIGTSCLIPRKGPQVFQVISHFKDTVESIEIGKY
jgi:hypothetical protein